MSLRIQQLFLTHFRNYENLHLKDIGSLTLFVGPNAVGKTNIIEGVDLLTALSSFRKPKIEQLVKWGEKSARLEAHISDGSRSLNLVLRIEDNQKSYCLNEKSKRIQDIRGLLPAVCFSPDDLNLIKGSQSIKRYALDALGSQLSSNYYAVRKDYEKILKQKNRMLKEMTTAAYLASIDEVLVSIGAQLSFKRAEILRKLTLYLQDFYHTIAGESEKIEIAYIPSWLENDPEILSQRDFTIDEARRLLAEKIRVGSEDEIQRKRTLWGPHTDSIEFFIKGKNAGIYGSQGQQRSLVLSFKLAQVALIQEILGQKPILLLDDVMSELDTARRNALMDFISDDIQTFITTTDLKYFNEAVLQRARIITLSKTGSSLTELSERGV